MSTEPTLDTGKTAESRTPAAENAYLLIGLASIVGLGVVLLQNGADRWSVIPTLIGAAGLAFRWRSAPLVLLASVAFIQLTPWLFGWSFGLRRPRSLALELSLCGAVLAYVVAQYRLFGLAATVFPTDPRRPGEGPPPRTVRVVGHEAPAALVTIAAATVGAFFLWEVVSVVPPAWNVRRSVWRVGLLVWIGGAALVLLASAIGYLGWRRLSPDEASLYLRDALWHEARREQRRIHRWRAWARRRSERAS